MLSFKKENVNEATCLDYINNELDNYKNICPYGSNSFTHYNAHFVIGTDLIFFMDDEETIRYRILSQHTEDYIVARLYPNCIGKAISNSVHPEEKFLPLLEILFSMGLI